MNAKLLIPGVALGLLLAMSACQKKAETPAAPEGGTPPASSPSDTSGGGTMSPDGSGTPSTPSTEPTTTPPAGGNPFGVQSGKVEYQVTGAEQGTEILSWDNWGGRMAISTKATMGTIAQDKTTLVTVDKVIALDNAAKTGTAMANPMKDVMLAGGSTDEMTSRMMSQMGATKQGTDTVLGKTCDKYVSATSSTCVWQGIALKTEMTVSGATTTKVATKIEENAAVDPAAFDIPAGMTVQDMSSSTGAPASDIAPTPAPDGH
jgi:hypothetical protein